MTRTLQPHIELALAAFHVIAGGAAPRALDRLARAAAVADSLDERSEALRHAARAFLEETARLDRRQALDEALAHWRDAHPLKVPSTEPIARHYGSDTGSRSPRQPRAPVPPKAKRRRARREDDQPHFAWQDRADIGGAA